MSRDGRYILSYEYQSYVVPTPMDRDKQTIQKYLSNYWPGEEVKAKFTELDWGHTVHFEMPKYTLPPDILDKLLADRVFEACDGDYYSEVESDHLPKALPSAEAQGEDNLTQPSGEQPTSVEWLETMRLHHKDLPCFNDHVAHHYLQTLIAEERRQAKIEALEDLLLAEDIGQGDVSTWNKVIRSRITTLRGENNE